MKKIYPILLILSIFFASSCNDKETSPLPEIKEISTQDLSENVIVQGATKIEGNLPASTGNITLIVPHKGQRATQTIGFNASFTSDKPVEGAYIQFKTEEGLASNHYFHIKKSHFSAQEEFNDDPIIPTGRIQQTQNNDLHAINIDFTPNMPLGSFCYLIAVYDADNNISEQQEVCVDINDWGGKDEVVGTWEFIISDYKTPTTQTYTCQNGSSYSSYSLGLDGKVQLTLGKSGNYEYDFTLQTDHFDRTASETTCTAEYQSRTTSLDREGHWFYNDLEETYTLISTSQVITYNVVGGNSSTHVSNDTTLITTMEKYQVKNDSLITFYYNGTDYVEGARYIRK